MIDPKNLETWLHEKAGPAHDALKADPARAVSADRVRYTLDELLAEAEASGQYPLPPEQREWVDAPAVGRELLPEDLQTVEAIAAFLADAEATAAPAYVQHARSCGTCAGHARHQVGKLTSIVMPGGAAGGSHRRKCRCEIPRQGSSLERPSSSNMAMLEHTDAHHHL